MNDFGKLLLLGALLLICSLALAQESDDCAECHAAEVAETPLVTMEMIDRSVHEGTDCVECHEEVEAAEHQEKPAPVNCGNCHDEEAELYQQHGIPGIDTSPHVPSCAACHGTHEILNSEEPEARTHVTNLAQTCGSCHENPEILKQHKFLPLHPIETYQSSVHGMLSDSEKGPVSCISCHGFQKSAHQILPTGDPKSSINHFTINSTCGDCHEDQNQAYLEGIHGQLMLRGKTNSPTCTNCHGEHQILSTKDSRSAVSPGHVAEGTCIPCHQSASLSEKYGMPVGELANFIDRFHGLKSDSVGETVANCSSCHKAHRVFSAEDPESSIHEDNLQETCGECHEGISESLAKSPIHLYDNIESKGWPYVFTIIYYIIITVTISGMLIYILLDYLRQVRGTLQKEQVQRMTRWDLLQHTMLALSFIVLVISGFALRFSDSWWANLLFGKTGLFTERSFIHRVGGLLLILISFMHLFYLRGKNGREFIKHILPDLNDLKKFWQMLRYNLGFSEQRPLFGRFSYVEKFEYWALIWGVIIMSITGIILWQDNFMIQYVSQTFLEVVRVIHYYEAWLATLSILIWHFYGTIFNPSVYPMNPSWITGKMPKDQDEHERGKHDPQEETPH